MATAAVDPTESNLSAFLAAEYFTKRELCDVLKRDQRTLDRWESLGIGPPRTVIGRLILYKKSSVLAWLEQSEKRSHSRRGR